MISVHCILGVVALPQAHCCPFNSQISVPRLANLDATHAGCLIFHSSHKDEGKSEAEASNRANAIDTHVAELDGDDGMVTCLDHSSELAAAEAVEVDRCLAFQPLGYLADLDGAARELVLLDPQRLNPA